MTQGAVIDCDKTSGLIMDFQQLIVNNVASDVQAVLGNASHVL